MGFAFQIFRVVCILNNGFYIDDETTGRMKLSESMFFSSEDEWIITWQIKSINS